MTAGVNGNGQGAATLTLEEFLAATEFEVGCELLPRPIIARRISRGEYLSLLPPLPPESAHWKVEEWEQREAAWLATLPANEMEARRERLRDVIYAVVSLAALRPALTIEDARRLGDHATAIADRILTESRLVKRPDATRDATPEPVGATA